MFFMENNENNVEMPDVVPSDQPENQIAAKQSAIMSDRELAELEAYKRHTEALKIELAEIRERFGENPDAVDPLKDIRAEMAEMKSGFAEIRAMFEELKNNKGNNNPPPVVNPPPPQQPYYFQPPTTPIMPFYQTPNFQPLIPAMPNFNNR
jgi:hypothetical protein